MSKKTRTDAALAVADAFLPVEHGAQETALNGARCLAIVIEQRAKARVAPHVGAEVLERLAEGNLHAVRAANALAHAHKAMTDVQADLGLDLLVGPDCPPNEGTLSAPTIAHLRAVG